MMINRHNILDLLGGDKRKYHSCIITCFSFDFIFFEQRVLPKLRQAGITNINIYVDAFQFENQINSFVGSELLDAKAGYSITPVKMIGAFHPKVLVAVGKTKGFLAIGSGNLTSSGLSSNEEIWGSFHITETDKTTEPFFKETASYLKKLESFVFGTNLLKLNWIKENSNWFNNLLDNDNSSKTVVNKDETFEMLFTYQEESIYKSIVERLPKKPKFIKILSPYYNTNGSFLNKLIQDVQPDKIHCIVDPLYGSVPYKYDNKYKIEFSDWNDLKRVEKYSKNRLHAKAIQFEYETETYFVFGSANATSEAFGANGNISINAETSILSHSKKPKDYFKELGVNFPNKGNYLIQDYDFKGQIASNENEKFNFLAFIKNVEVDGNEITIYAENKLNYKVNVCVEDANGLNIFNQDIDCLNEKNIINIENNNLVKPFRLAVFSTSERISNYALIHQKAFLLNTNPDARIAHFNSLLNSDFFGDFELEELIDFISLKSDFSENRSLRQVKSNQIEEEAIEDVEAISEEEFNKNSANLIGNESFNNYTTSRIEEFLNSLNFETNAVDDVSESIEDAALAAGVDGLDDEDKSISSKRIDVPFDDGVRIRCKIEKTVEKITNALYPQKSNHLKIIKFPEANSLATLHQLNALLIGFHIILKKRSESYFENRSLLKLQYSDIDALSKIEKQFTIQRLEKQVGNLKNEVSFTINENSVNPIKDFLKNNISVKIKYIDETASQTLTHSYFSHRFWSNESNYLCINDYLKDGLASYLLLLTKQIEIKDDKENSVWIEKKRRLKLLSIAAILNYNWTTSHQNTKKLLLLNIFHYLGNNEDFETLVKDLENYIEKLNLNSFVKSENFIDVIYLYKQYLKWLNQYNSDVKVLKRELNNLSENNIIFSKTYGFSKIANFYKSKLVNLETPLGVNDEERNVFGFVEVFIGSQPIFF
ncbi:hypothetical protein BC952_1694 [Flavobacterium limicola]|uniref:Uncharacterized protein n=1 Tax=Flavobacterium limicola TaxID=180441 RepID=A0A495S3F4_9FLAO|nr:hypothetical protein [Flavobacterium limicola]RKS93844.1 hypothetical protein BC952_1694 [Flavobacterium limicola]